MKAYNVDGFDWDEGNFQKCQKHGLSIADIESVFQGHVSVFPDPAHSYTEQRFIGIGKTHQNRLAFIAFTVRHQNNSSVIRPISARYMHQKEIDHYEQALTKI